MKKPSLYRSVNTRTWMVAVHEGEKNDYICIGESTFFSGLWVDDAGLLQRVNPQLTLKQMKPYCNCCTHTFNGVVFPPISASRR